MEESLATNIDLVEGTLPSNSVGLGSGPTTLGSWQASIKAAIRTRAGLLQAVGLAETFAETIDVATTDSATTDSAASAAEAEFSVFAPLEYVARMRQGDPMDPLLLQVLATAAESQPDGVLDPVGDQSATILPGLLQKYQRRALLVASGACAIHCRYCFRRHFPYASAPSSLKGWMPAIDYLRRDQTIDEIILSGGDPLMVADVTLEELVNQINAMPHIKRVRIHTRLPVVIPSRVCQELLAWIGRCRARVYVVLHINHAAEIDDAVVRSLDLLHAAGAVLLNQSVLLKQINDQADQLCELSLKLVDHRVLPYYLHQLDPVRGAMHFRVEDQRALELIQQMRSRLPGYAVPQLVREIAGMPNKSPITQAL